MFSMCLAKLSHLTSFLVYIYDTQFIYISWIPSLFLTSNSTGYGLLTLYLSSSSISDIKYIITKQTVMQHNHFVVYSQTANVTVCCDWDWQIVRDAGVVSLV